MNRHLPELKAGGICVYNGDKVKPGPAPAGVQLCPLPVFELAGKDALPIMQNTVALGALVRLLGLEFEALSSVFQHTFKKKPQVVEANIDRKSTRLNSSHQIISYAVFCLKKKNQ